MDDEFEKCKSIKKDFLLSSSLDTSNEKYLICQRVKVETCKKSFKNVVSTLQQATS